MKILKIKNLKIVKNQGFSLIELLIVITIIGLLSTIVLNSLSSSRSKAYDSKIKQQLNSFRTSAEIYFSNQEPNSYGVTVGCNNGMFNDFNSSNGTPGVFIALGNLPPGVDDSDRECQSTGSSYAIQVNLYSGNSRWCIDNRGFSGEVPGLIVGPSTVCN